MVIEPAERDARGRYVTQIFFSIFKVNFKLSIVVTRLSIDIIDWVPIKLISKKKNS